MIVGPEAEVIIVFWQLACDVIGLVNQQLQQVMSADPMAVTNNFLKYFKFNFFKFFSFFNVHAERNW
jgi:hypothetical protein